MVGLRNQTLKQDNVMEMRFDSNINVVDVPKRYTKHSKWGIEDVIPLPYVGATVTGKTELRPFSVRVVGVRWVTATSPDIGERAEFIPYERKGTKKLTLHVQVTPRSQTELPIRKDAEGRVYVDLYAHEFYPIDRPDAVCIRELVLTFLRHELEESIMVDDVRIWDPHVGRPTGI